MKGGHGIPIETAAWPSGSKDEREYKTPLSSSKASHQVYFTIYRIFKL